MNEIKSVAIIFCVSSIVSAIAVFLVPEGSTKKLYNQIISLFMIAVLIVPLFSIDFSDVGMSIDENVFSADIDEEYSVMLFEYMLDSGEEIVKLQVENSINEILHYDHQSYISFVSSQTGEAILESVTIYIDVKDAVYSRIIKNKVGELTGIVPEVIIVNE